jgi:Putative auto-transporter adhesin, head GIN domain
VKISGSGNVKLGDLAAKRADIDILGSGHAEIAPQDSLNVDVAGSGTVYLRTEPKQIATSIHGSGHIVHPDGQIQSLPRHDQHARADDAAIQAAVMDVIAHDGDEDRDELDRAKAELKAKIKARVARELAQEEEP